MVIIAMMVIKRESIASLCSSRLAEFLLQWSGEFLLRVSAALMVDVADAVDGHIVLRDEGRDF